MLSMQSVQGVAHLTAPSGFWTCILPTPSSLFFPRTFLFVLFVQALPVLIGQCLTYKRNETQLRAIPASMLLLCNAFP